MTHECDYPADALNLPKVTRDVIGPGLAPDEIDRAVRELTEQGRSIYELDEPGLRAPAARPDRHPGAVQRVRGVRRRRARDRRAHGPGAGDRLAGPAHARRGARRRPHARPGHRHARTRASTSSRTPRRASTASGSPSRDAPRRRVAMLEWLDPVFVGGHWVPQLIEYAGGVDLLGLPGEPSEQRSWEEVAAARPEVVVVAPCGYDVERGYAGGARPTRDELDALGAERIVVADAVRLVLPPRPAPGRGPGVARPRAAPGPRAGAARRRARASARRRGEIEPATIAATRRSPRRRRPPATVDLRRRLRQLLDHERRDAGRRSGRRRGRRARCPRGRT